MSLTNPHDAAVLCFRDDVRQMLAAINELDVIESIEGAYAELIDRRRNFVSYGAPADRSARSQAFANLAVIGQVQLHRAERLIASSGTMISERNIYGLALLIRGHYESTAILGYLCDRVSAFLKGNITFETVVFDISHIMMGAKHDLFAEMPDPTNIMTAIGKADRYIEQSGFIDKRGMLEDCYAWLSEFAHPNFNSSDAALRLDTERNGFEFRHGGDLSNEEIQMVGYLDISASVFIRLFDDLAQLATDAFAERATS